MKIITVLTFSLVLSGCTTAELSKYVGQTGTLSNRHTVVAIGTQQCQAMRVQCVSGQFNEWRTEEQEVRCTCNQ